MAKSTIDVRQPFDLNKENAVVEKVWALIFEFFEGNTLKTLLWFDTENPLLGQVSPVQMIRWGRAEKLLKNVESWLSENAPG